MVSMKDIAGECGVSVATVSKALNHQKDIGAATAAKIREKAKEMGYFPNSAARTLITKRSYNIGVLFYDDSDNGLNHEYFASILQSFREQAELQGYDITFINTHIGKTQKTYYEYCRYRGVDGVVIACVDFQNKEVTELLQSDIPTVTIDYTYHSCTSILSDNRDGMRQLVEYVHSLGHTLIAYIYGQKDYFVTKERLASFYAACQAFGIHVREEYLKEAAYLNTSLAEELTCCLLHLKTPPTCILYPDDVALFGGRNAIMKKGLRIPEDISIAGYDGNKTIQLLPPKITTIKQNSAALGKRAAEELIQFIENPKTTFVQRILIQGILLPGESVGSIS